MIATIATWLIARNPAMTLGAARRLAKLEEATTALESERRATTAGAAAAQSSDAMKEAEDADPEAAQAPAGPVSRAAARRFPVRS